MKPIRFGYYSLNNESPFLHFGKKLQNKY
ncbi:hypothetical protein DXA45_03390 [Enterococcus avium]|uniref:Uncharacterized protein n=1 Tax=Enterococcus avium TaxID=33945 RepID=A0A437USS3_ENTAV|nr:hypothetical protein EH197_15705 [Enterococcus avium]RGY44213.1 hypothetical protein DXA45_03390 [Enterococcus avium]ROZ32186.1 hypothetical protein EGX28_17925 [Enterococcus avium]RVU96570.1 hypothetical protein EK398_10655 [Enterococcus avium]TXV47308.1 hypothetical protein D4M89_08380 [Enterococcus sp. T0101B.F-10]